MALRVCNSGAPRKACAYCLKREWWHQRGSPFWHCANCKPPAPGRPNIEVVKKEA